MMSGPNQPLRVTMADAPGLIAGRAAAARARRAGAFVVAVGGPVGSGKSTLARLLSTCVVSTDDFLPDYDRVPYAERDLPERMDIAELSRVLGELRAGRATEGPVWSFQTHCRVAVRRVEPAPLVVCEGIHALHAPIAQAADLRVFVSAEAATRWERWENLERTGQRGWGVEVARRFFEEVAEPTFAARAAAYRRSTDVLVLNP